MRQTSLGSSRTLLLAGLALAAAVLLGSFVLVTLTGDSSDDPVAEPDGAAGAVLGTGRAGRGTRDPKRPRVEPEDGEEDEPGDGPEEWTPRGQPTGTRTPEGPEFVVNAETLRAEFAARHWEEVRRQIDELTAKGEPVPSDVLKSLLDMLAKDDLRLDAVLALGGVKDDSTARSLAELASSNAADVPTRQAALDALAKSGQKSALPMLQSLVAAEGLDDGVARHAMYAIAGIGGPEATKTLLAELKKHANDDLQNAIVTALGRTQDSDGAIAGTLREAAQKGDEASMRAVIVAAQLQGEAAGPELKTELANLVDSTSSLGAFTDEVDRQRMQAMAMYAAATAGVVEPVLRKATTAGPLRDSALDALSRARGDGAAKLIAGALSRANDDVARNLLTKALGETGSFEATPTLVALLDDPSANIRSAAARGLGQVRDPAAVKPILSHLPKAPPDRDFALGLVGALGTIGANEAVPALEKLAATEKLPAKEEAFWSQVKPFVQNAIVRINTGNPESERTK